MDSSRFGNDELASRSRQPVRMTCATGCQAARPRRRRERRARSPAVTWAQALLLLVLLPACAASVHTHPSAFPEPAVRLPAPGQAEVWQGHATPCAVACRGPASDARPHLHALAQGTHVWEWSPHPPHELGAFSANGGPHPNQPPHMPLRADLELARAWLAVCAELTLRDNMTEADGALFAACGRTGPEPLVPWARVMAGGRWVRTGLSTEDGRVVLVLHLAAPALRTFVRGLESALEVYDRVAAGEIWQPSSHGSNWLVPDEPPSETGDDR